MAALATSDQISREQLGAHFDPDHARWGGPVGPFADHDLLTAAPQWADGYLRVVSRRLMTGGVAIHACGMRHTYGRGDRAVRVLDGLDLEISGGEYVALRGPSGAGKSTLLALIGGLDTLQGGSVRVGEEELLGLRGRRLAAYRRRVVGFVFQHYGLVDVLTARENVMLALSLTPGGAGDRRGRADALLEAVGLAGRLHHRPAELSGGERQRVAIARALANEPQLLLADEPTGNLDEEATARVLDLLGDVRDRTGCTLLVVTHDPYVAARADVVLHVRDGRIAA